MHIKTVNFILLAASLWPPIEVLAQVSNNDEYEFTLIKKTDKFSAVLNF